MGVPLGRLLSSTSAAKTEFEAHAGGPWEALLQREMLGPDEGEHRLKLKQLLNAQPDAYDSAR